MRTVQEEQVHQLKVISHQLAPMSLFGKSALWFMVIFVAANLAGAFATVMGWMK